MEGLGAGAGAYSGPSPLRKRLRDVADTALAAGITVPMHTTFEVVRAPCDGEEGVTQVTEGAGGGMDFIVSVISGGALEAKVSHGDGRTAGVQRSVPATFCCANKGVTGK